jgi:hypothetical protein
MEEQHREGRTRDEGDVLGVVCGIKSSYLLLSLFTTVKREHL